MDNYKLVIIPLIGVILSQFIKFIIESIRVKKLLFNRLFYGSGGLPSSHAVLVSSLTSLIYLNYGFNSLFCVSLIFSFIVLYDSFGVRYQVGMQAKVLNEITSYKFNELVGHTFFEVLTGMIFGIFISLIFN